MGLTIGRESIIILNFFTLALYNINICLEVPCNLESKICVKKWLLLKHVCVEKGGRLPSKVESKISVKK